ncbi:MAG: aspartate/glutamate racemase family protein [Gammaproteobacteria bacterium]|uniref:aspartate/glutamate racemase family protein n=1 Tax=Rhodoferax sp. TaxID=50421 RepID=UPI0017959742|nr:aspartate/glutamate racemase family protein [Rhodoferax sp.]MBU3899290.1 aspartate/glutamate racemase family protein [Gammaproteobacteria bacterium]MBA3058171.1 aspartate/glutamate racemase family protein [Rhodoferax sp.]MBU3996908.1 aspartate/glutamate racemase family protein [Gammaproteobacteria bacterium]MBU4081266.1 aspartate/glutamate racemase family protein [Gammaproteobacteria bacterium]MBU4115277.1 aspartate/glutamate racemase family protein [Gammaproteobacteria bacterium]
MNNAEQKTLGLIGGMSWESTVPYYREINRAVKEQLGGLHSAKIILYSVDFAEVEQLQATGQWEAAGALLAEIAQKLEGAGADALVLCTNTMHKVASAISSAVNIPLLHIADPTAMAIKQAGYTSVGLLGTRFTMEQDFYRERLEQHGLTVLTPHAPQRELVHGVIYAELCLGQVLAASRDAYLQVIAELSARGAQAIILGCTEIALLVQPQHCALPLFDTTALHARSAARWALSTPHAATPY